MIFIDVPNPFGSRIFDAAKYDPILDAPRSKRKVGERRSMIPAAPKPVSTTLKNFLLDYNK